MEDEYSLQNIADILGITRRAVQKRAQKEGWNCEVQPNPKGGGSQKFCRHDRLPRDVREAIGRHVLETTLTRTDAVVSVPESIARVIAQQNVPPASSNGGPGKGDASPARARQKTRSAGSTAESPSIDVPVNGNDPRAPEFTDRPDSLSIPQSSHPALCKPSVIIPERANADGLAKYRVVTEWRRIIAAQPWGKKNEATQAFLLAYNSGRLLPTVYETVGALSDKTLYRLDRMLRENGDDYHAISDGRGGWRSHGTTKWRPRDLCRDAQEDLLRCWLRPEQPSVTLAIRAARMLLEKRGAAEDSSDATWRRWLNDWAQRHQHLVVMMREGEKAYRDKVGPYITRDDSLLEVGQVLVADGHDLNFQVIHPATGKPVRMALITFFDWASRMPVGIQMMPTENTVAIQAALRMAILTLGKVPQCVYLDNGKAFKSRFFTATNPDLQDLSGIYARLGITTLFAQPYNARAKVLERWHLTLNEQCERIIPTYTGASIEDKPAWLSRNEKLHRAWHEARTQGWTPNIREAAHIILRYCEWYGQQPHSGLDGRRPIDVLEAGRGSGVDAEAINREFLWRTEVTPRRCRVTLYNIEYESDCLHGWSGKAVARYDTADLGTIWLYSLDGAYLGEARPVVALHPLARLFGDEVSVDQVKTVIASHKRLEKQTAEGLKELGAAPETVEGLKMLPWNQRAAVIQGGKSDVSEPGGRRDPHEEEVDEAERRRLQLVMARAVEEAADTEAADTSRIAVDRPEHFRGEAARYEWAFRESVQYGRQIPADDEKFMWFYESTDEFRKNFAQRYADLRELYGLYGPESMGAGQ